MHDELTAQDIAMMQKELDHRKLELMPELIEEVKRTRAFGDLSENFEYKAAKQAQNRNRSRIRYLERMIKSARVIEDKAAADEVGLFDKVELYFEDDDETETIQVVTTVRCDPLQGRISREAPLGKAVLGRKQGDRVAVTTEDGDSYTVVIRSISKQADDGSGSILFFYSCSGGCCAVSSGSAEATDNVSKNFSRSTAHTTCGSSLPRYCFVSCPIGFMPQAAAT